MKVMSPRPGHPRPGTPGFSVRGSSIASLAYGAYFLVFVFFVSVQVSVGFIRFHGL